MTDDHYLQGGLDYDFIEPLDCRLQCSICLLCLRQPYQTSCGHLFCHSCIITWMEQGKTCPHDNASLGEGDLFPDPAISQQIDQLKIRCPKGCAAVLQVREIESHQCGCPQCGQNSGLPQNLNGQHRLICPNVDVACLYGSIGCQERPARKALEDHLQGAVASHLRLLYEKLSKLQQMQSMPISRNDQTLQDLYDRLVSLEQALCEQSIRQEELMRRLANNNGQIVWRIKQFTACKLNLHYSEAFYTAPQMGYKLCLRCSISPEAVGIFVHLMAGQDDDILQWPFEGKISITLKNRRPGGHDLIETMSTSNCSAAFERPTGLRNKIGFGLPHFISVKTLMAQGFWDSSKDDIVIIGRVTAQVA